ncbi:branched-chain amino acid ABC transporter permease [Corticibacterium sp. UT-5YL-CI-8]|nr:branched-chain amino acid ABC transporter permease [Tianweitania sp. UT-5YL-CI-8]
MSDLIAQLAVFGIVNGFGYAIAALGLTIIFGVMRIVNFAHGEFYMLGAFVAATLIATTGVPYLVAIPLSSVVVGVIGIASERVFIAPLHNRSHLTLLLSTLAISMIFLNAAELIWGSAPRVITSPFEESLYVIGPVFLTGQRVFIVAVGIVVVVGLGLFLKYSTAGKIIRATAQNPEGAALIGVNIGLVRSMTFGFGCGLAALSGALLAPISMTYPVMGQALAIKAFAVTILGGLGSLPGAIIGGLTLGVVEAIAGGTLSTAYRDLFSYAAIIIVLLLRPQGLMGAAR